MVIWFCFAILCLFISPEQSQAAISLVINDNSYQSDPMPELKDGRVYVPLRTISEGLGYNVSWSGVHRCVSITTTDASPKEVTQICKDVTVFINGERLYIDKDMGTPYIKKPGYTMVPLRAISEGLGAIVNWQNGLVTVLSEPKEGDLADQLELSVGDETWMPSAHESIVEPSVDEVGELSESEEKAVEHDLPSAQNGFTAENLTILGDSVATIDQINRFLAAKEAEMKYKASVNGSRFVPFPKNIGALYLSIAPRYGIRGDVALAQAIQETGYFQYGNEVLPEQNNYCGLGAIGRRTTNEDLEKQVFSNINSKYAYLSVGLHGWCYATPAIGVEAHLQHLYSYASEGSLPQGAMLYDGRFQHGNRGKAIVWHDLNGKWAVPGNGYGETIVENIWRNMLAY